MEGCKSHCFHETGEYIVGFPSIQQNVCCWCGIKAWYQDTVDPSVPHGEHLPVYDKSIFQIKEITKC